MPYVGKSGVDAVAIAFTHICKVINRYHLKLDAAIDQAVSDGRISSGDATTAHTFVDTATAVCGIFLLVADNSGV